jgi:hypothetical protein
MARLTAQRLSDRHAAATGRGAIADTKSLTHSEVVNQLRPS